MNIDSPQSMVLYNQFMGGVDRRDQLRKYYYVPMKGRKFYRYIFWFLLEVSITNSYILYNNFGTDPGLPLNTLVKFCRQLHYCSRKQVGRPPSGGVAQNHSTVHFCQEDVQQQRRDV